jgi:hypothetical protein
VTASPTPNVAPQMTDIEREEAEPQAKIEDERIVDEVLQKPMVLTVTPEIHDFYLLCHWQSVSGLAVVIH